MPPAPESIAAIEESLRSGRALGYPESVGYPDARLAVANYFDEGPTGNWRVTAGDVVMTHGASGALEMAISVLAEEGKNVLFPKPLFTAYETMSAVANCEIRYYNLLPELNWEVDLAHLESLIDENTAFVILNKSVCPFRAPHFLLEPHDDEGHPGLSLPARGLEAREDEGSKAGTDPTSAAAPQTRAAPTGPNSTFAISRRS